jgi:hypothetical protein
MNRNALIALVALLLLGGAAVFWAVGQNGEDEARIPEGWQLYQNREFGFQIHHPPEATVGQEAETNIKFTYLGGPQATGEVTDGFTLTVGTHRKPAGQSLRDFAESYYQDQLRAGTSVSAPSRTELYGVEAYRFQIETLGEVTIYAVEASDADRAHTISYIIADPNDSGYESMVEDMLRTFRIISVQDGSVVAPPGDITNGEGPPAEAPLVRSVELAVLNVGDDGEGERRGCDFVEFVERSVPPTTAPLTASMRELFSIATTSVNGFYHFIPNTAGTLEFERASIQDGTARIHLSGELSGLTGVCDNPRARIQIEETALRFETVERVEIYLNGERTNLTPSGM